MMRKDYLKVRIADQHYHPRRLLKYPINLEMEDEKNSHDPPISDITKWKNSCTNRGVTECFYLSFEVESPFPVEWALNLEYHFGLKTISTHDFFFRIHPFWRKTLKAIIAEALVIMEEIFAKKQQPDHVSYHTKIPLLQTDQSYCWYHQNTVFTGSGPNNQLANVLCEYHRICPFDDLRPPATFLSLNGKGENEYSTRLKNAAKKAMDETLRRVLSPTNYRNLHAYRRYTEFTEGGWKVPSSQEMRAVLAMNRQSLNKANTRLLGQAKLIFPACALFSVAELAAFLNNSFGLPEERIVLPRTF